MNTLPLPDLGDTLITYQQWLRPLVDDKTYRNSEQALADFRHLDAPKLQRLLEQRAAIAAPDSWLIDYWRNLRLANRGSLPLAGNQTMKIEWKAPQSGLKRVSHFVHALARVHRDYLHGEITCGDDTCREQWRILLGACRRPMPECDQYLFNEDDSSARHINILYKGRGWTMDILDNKGGIASPAQIENTLYRLIHNDAEAPDLPFAAPSVFPNEQAREIRAQLNSRSENAAIWQSIEKSLFILSLDDAHIIDDEDALNDAAFSDGSAFWAYKPLNYRCNLSDDRYFLHSESSWIDASSLADILALAQKNQHDGKIQRKNTLPDDLNLAPLDWQIDKHETKEQDSGTYKLIKEALAEYRHHAESYTTGIYDLYLNDQEQHLLKHNDPDALMQIALQYAQYKVHKTVRSSRENIDMRHYTNGRKCYMQTVTATSKAAATAIYSLADSSSILPLIEAYNEEHLMRKAHCLHGEDVYGHLLGLESIAREQKQDIPAFFTDPGYLTLTQNYISTISLGCHGILSYIAFTAGRAENIAINYTYNRNNINLVLTHPRNRTREIQKFATAVQAGIKQLLRILALSEPQDEV
ncbi:choline/carnitine O-acyltransferase [Cardiobacterium valvarum]|uniref:Choline/Carnitine o-acyltransferase n=1 Tax=Cardiobacterium valvarum TaxID=194702 RepID=A0A381E1H9_9GAMM|nr:choline/carnitine O-acyltransferase [Cardiobacterium valvarum]SUX19650.1 Choline/Carnitine o-acyltransferase [Cardiobacterium valvarum]